VRRARRIRRDWIFTVVSWPAARIAVIVCFLPRPADARDAPDVRSARPVSVSYCEEPSPAAGVCRRTARLAPRSAVTGADRGVERGWFSAARWTISRGRPVRAELPAGTASGRWDF